VRSRKNISKFILRRQLATMKKGMSTLEISRQHGIHQETAWFFKRKVQQAMASLDSQMLSGLVEADETVIGGYEAGALGRSRGKRKSVEVAVEIGPDDEPSEKAQMIRGKARTINDYSAAELSRALDEMVAPEALVVTDQWTSYRRAVGKRKHLAIRSDKGDTMPEIHRLIFNLKNWIRGIHHKVSAFHIQQYLNEFFCRFNFRNCINKLPFGILQEMVANPWSPYKSVIAK